MTTCQGSDPGPPTLSSLLHVTWGAPFCGYVTANTVTVPASRFTVTTMESSGDTATADPRLALEATGTDAACDSGSFCSNEDDSPLPARHAPRSDDAVASAVRAKERRMFFMESGHLRTACQSHFARFVDARGISAAAPRHAMRPPRRTKCHQENSSRPSKSRARSRCVRLASDLGLPPGRLGGG